MTTTRDGQGPRHVVTLDVSARGRPALETAVRLAAISGAHLEGVFVEDINLLRLADLPFLRELRPSSLAEEAIDAQRLQRELRSLARQARHMLEQIAGEMGVPWSFQVWRGPAVAESLTEAFAADILSLAQVDSRIARHTRLTSVRRSHRQRQDIRHIHVLYSGSKSGERALATACALAGEIGADITVLLAADRKSSRKKLRHKASTILASQGRSARLMQLPEKGLGPLVEVMLQGNSHILIAETGNRLLQQAGLNRCLEILDCPILLVR